MSDRDEARNDDKHAAPPEGGRSTDDNVIFLANLDKAMRRCGSSASLPELAAAAGVEEKVIHVAFPGGRADLVNAITGNACGEFDDVVTTPMLTAPTRSEALREAADGLAAYYEGGARHCLFELFSVPVEGAHVPRIKDTAARFLNALTDVLQRNGRGEDEARAKALRLFAELQGTLILSRLTGETGLFRAFTESLARAR